ncbi:MAG TPA: sigma-54 dependent transcriptional regulator [Candidatus Binatia bacterium]|jgi:DNA-binding NtrC family response regulator
MAQILIADDDAASCQLFAEVLEREGYKVDQVHTGEEALARLRERLHDLLLVDVRMPGMSGLAVTRAIRKESPSLPILVMTAFGSIETAIEAIREGAFDFISKPMNLEELKKSVARALPQQQQQAVQKKAVEAIEGGDQFGVVIGKSPAMVEVYKTIARVAPTKSTVLILGESGTGKELIARAIHEHSARAAKPFVAVDCGALTDTLLEGELFGHVRGAFTGAVHDKKSVFEEAEGGTCFLDEINDISLHLQAKLLRVLQEHEVRRVGASKSTKIDVRVVAATNKELEPLVSKGALREDLYYRLKVVSIYLPPIRERPEDIPSLAEYFLRRYSHESGKSVTSISKEAMKLLCDYTWPGNVRELENVIDRAVALSRQSLMTPEDLPVEVRERKASFSSRHRAQQEEFFFPGTPTMDEVKKQYLLNVLGLTQGNIARAAKILDMDRRSLYRMLLRYKIQPYSKSNEP